MRRKHDNGCTASCRPGQIGSLSKASPATYLPGLNGSRCFPRVAWHPIARTFGATSQSKPGCMALGHSCETAVRRLARPERFGEQVQMAVRCHTHRKQAPWVQRQPGAFEVGTMMRGGPLGRRANAPRAVRRPVAGTSCLARQVGTVATIDATTNWQRQPGAILAGTIHDHGGPSAGTMRNKRTRGTR